MFGLKEWPELLQGKKHLVVKLNCHDNQLESLPNFPNLIKLNCSLNQLKSLPDLTKLTRLYCEANKLKSFPKFTSNTCIFCDYNKLESLPNFPKLTHLYCEDLIYSPNHPGKFYKNLRQGDWSYENTKLKLK